jgi:hypothetical protein
MADDIPRDVKPPDLTVGWFDYWRRDGPHAWVPPMNGDVRGPAPRTHHDAAEGTSRRESVSRRTERVWKRVEGYSRRPLGRLMPTTRSELHEYQQVVGVQCDRARETSTGYTSRPRQWYAADYTVESYHDPHPEWTAQWTAIIDNLLLASADVIKISSDFLDAVNNASQFYVKADKRIPSCRRWAARPVPSNDVAMLAFYVDPARIPLCRSWAGQRQQPHFVRLLTLVVSASR